MLTLLVTLFYAISTIYSPLDIRAGYNETGWYRRVSGCEKIRCCAVHDGASDGRFYRRSVSRGRGPLSVACLRGAAAARSRGTILGTLLSPLSRSTHRSTARRVEKPAALCLSHRACIAVEVGFLTARSPPKLIQAPRRLSWKGAFVCSVSVCTSARTPYLDPRMREKKRETLAGMKTANIGSDDVLKREAPPIFA